MIQLLLQSPGSMWDEACVWRWSQLLSGLQAAGKVAILAGSASLASMGACSTTLMCHRCSWVLIHLCSSSSPDITLKDIFRMKIRSISLIPKTACRGAKVKVQVPFQFIMADVPLMGMWCVRPRNRPRELEKSKIVDFGSSSLHFLGLLFSSIWHFLLPIVPAAIGNNAALPFFMDSLPLWKNRVEMVT